MIKVSIDDTGYNGHILLEPNLSLSWKTNVRLFIFISFVTLLIAAYFVSMGGWLVLPFSGLELVMIFSSMYLFFRHYNCCEVIHFTADKVIIERGKKTAEEFWEYQRHWSKIHIREHGVYDIPKVSIKSHGKEIELGSFLGYKEKMYFIKTLEEITQKFIRSNQSQGAPD